MATSTITGASILFLVFLTLPHTPTHSPLLTGVVVVDPLMISTLKGNAERREQTIYLFMDLLQDTTFKERYLPHYLSVYPTLLEQQMVDVPKVEVVIYKISPQLFSIPALTLPLIRSGRLLSFFLDVTKKMFDRVPDSKNNRLDFESNYMTTHHSNFFALLNDFHSVLNNAPSSSHIITNRLDFVQEFLQLCTRLQLSNAERRQRGTHVEFEKNSWQWSLPLEAEMLLCFNTLLLPFQPDNEHRQRMMDEHGSGSGGDTERPPMLPSTVLHVVLLVVFHELKQWLRKQPFKNPIQNDAMDLTTGNGDNVATSSTTPSSSASSTSSSRSSLGEPSSTETTRARSSSRTALLSFLRESFNRVSQRRPSTTASSSSSAPTTVSSSTTTSPRLLSPSFASTPVSPTLSPTPSSDVFEPLEGVIPMFDVQQEDISFHIPLHRIFSKFLNELLKVDEKQHTGAGNYGQQVQQQQQQQQQQPEFYKSLSTVFGFDHRFDLLLAEHPLHIQIIRAQVRAGLWVRNGASIPTQAYFYCRSYTDQLFADLFLLQTSLVLAGAENFFQLLLRRWDVLHLFDSSVAPASLILDMKQQVRKQAEVGVETQHKRTI
jgi:hypothetical protein